MKTFWKRSNPRLILQETQGGWKKSPANPVLGGDLGTCFDISVLFDTLTKKYRMWFSWRPQQSIALVESEDGEHWTTPQIVLKPELSLKGEIIVNRPNVIFHERMFHMWYTSQDAKSSRIWYAMSPDGIIWTRVTHSPVIKPEFKWEKPATMCPNVVWDDQQKLFRMWYSGGNQYEPNAIGYATSPDGIQWNKTDNPIFIPDKNSPWEKDRVTAAHILPWKGQFLMFYIGFSDMDHASIGIARSPDGITNWERNPHNPIISSSIGQWDHDACYKPYAIFDGTQWHLWYNGRNAKIEQIGVAYHLGEDLGFNSNP